MKDRDPLLREVMADDADDHSTLAEFRQASLALGLSAVRRQRRQRRVCQVGLMVAAATALLVGAEWVRRASAPPPSAPTLTHVAPQPSPPLAQPAVPAPATVVEAQPTPAPLKVISDRELFALFPDRAKALIGPLGRQRFVLLNSKPASNTAKE